jgi:hypothetical protein
VIEQTYLGQSDGKLNRPFSRSAQVQCRGCSGPLPRVITDFGADNAFGRVSEKVAEHYGIPISLSAAARLTERHAQSLKTEDITPPASQRIAPLTLIAETDGRMIPVVPTGEAGRPEQDRRKKRPLSWKEARLALIRRPDEIEPTFAVTLGDANPTGEALKRLAQAAGLTRRTHVHGLGDGAPWIAEQMEIQFGGEASYLIDLYHLCDSLAAAAPVCCPDNAVEWMTQPKHAAKEGAIPSILATLAPHREPKTTPDDQAPVRRCHRDIANRPGQFDSPAALAANRPIGSGEVESAHRYVIQERLKLPGAWWLTSNAQAMLNLRSLRANHLWHIYWDRLAA